MPTGTGCLGSKSRKMFQGVNSRQIQKMMQQMGVAQTEIPAKEVVIKSDEKEIVILNPSVSKVNVMGQDSFQITGEIHERASRAEINKEDVKTVMEQAGVTEEEAGTALEKTKGDIAAAILQLKGE